ncbi:NADH-dependent fumarate reductase [Angomonas deanei]|nr:NADH-dependent fumarate reductase [Angomonas deanei]|eukprot:EPY28425.1 NADH-dependent fumarate reductase [Angomonas deanei]
MFCFAWVRVPQPLIPEVALALLPPIFFSFSQEDHLRTAVGGLDGGGDTTGQTTTNDDHTGGEGAGDTLGAHIGILNRELEHVGDALLVTGVGGVVGDGVAHEAPSLQHATNVGRVELENGGGGEGIGVHAAVALDRRLGNVVLGGYQERLGVPAEDGGLHLGARALDQVLVVTTGGDGLIVQLHHTNVALLLLILVGVAQLLQGRGADDPDTPGVALGVVTVGADIPTPLKEDVLNAGSVELLHHVVHGVPLVHSTEVELGVGVQTGDDAVGEVNLEAVVQGAAVDEGVQLIARQRLPLLGRQAEALHQGAHRRVEGAAGGVEDTLAAANDALEGGRHLVLLADGETVDDGHLTVGVEVIEDGVRHLKSGGEHLLPNRLGRRQLGVILGDNLERVGDGVGESLLHELFELPRTAVVAQHRAGGRVSFLGGLCGVHRDHGGRRASVSHFSFFFWLKN